MKLFRCFPKKGLGFPGGASGKEPTCRRCESVTIFLNSIYMRYYTVLVFFLICRLQRILSTHLLFCFQLCLQCYSYWWWPCRVALMIAIDPCPISAPQWVQVAENIKSSLGDSSQSSLSWSLLGTRIWLLCTKLNLWWLFLKGIAYNNCVFN